MSDDQLGIIYRHMFYRSGYRYSNQRVMGFSVVFTSIVQLIVFWGFSAIITQLHLIKKYIGTPNSVVFTTCKHASNVWLRRGFNG